MEALGLPIRPLLVACQGRLDELGHLHPPGQDGGQVDVGGEGQLGVLPGAVLVGEADEVRARLRRDGGESNHGHLGGEGLGGSHGREALGGGGGARAGAGRGGRGRGEQLHEGGEHVLHVLSGLLGALPSLPHDDPVRALDDDALPPPLGLPVRGVGGDALRRLVEGLADAPAVVRHEPALDHHLDLAGLEAGSALRAVREDSERRGVVLDVDGGVDGVVVSSDGLVDV
mmetsp:Transcript_5397/g.10284  ORF Transcript_5397/g.10284 Transcript_5397/m.10284 type:complete len:229 (+) Transcript_5397:271-957(+)